MRVLVVGAGSTGGYFGGRLAQAGRDVTFLVRPARAAALRRDGLRIVSPHGDLTLEPKLVMADAIERPFDIVLLALKAYALDAALADFAPAVGPSTMILPLLNGMRHLRLLAARFGEDPVIGGACRIASDLDGQGRVVQMTRMHEIAYGERDRRASARIAGLDALMRDAGFTARLSPDIEQEMWEKWIMLATIGGITCLMRGNAGEIAAAPGGADLIHRFLDETVRVVTAVGHAPGEALVAGARTQLTQAGSPLTSSMYRDLQKGGPVEADQIIGDLAAHARQAGLDTPLLDAAWAQLSVYQARLSAAS